VYEKLYIETVISRSLRTDLSYADTLPIITNEVINSSLTVVCDISPVKKNIV